LIFDFLNRASCLYLKCKERKSDIDWIEQILRTEQKNRIESSRRGIKQESG